MALIAMTTADTIEFVSDKDPAKTKVKQWIDPEDHSKGEILTDEIGADATIFMLSGLDVFLMGHIYDSASVLSNKQGSDEVGIHTRVNQTNIEAARHGLRGWKNFKDARGSHIKFETKTVLVNGREYEVASDDTMKRLGLRLIQEIAGKVKAISEVDASEEKN